MSVPDERLHIVVINDEEQYSIWMADRPLPAGWHDTGHRGTKARCLELIRDLWKDMRPRTARDASAR